MTLTEERDRFFMAMAIEGMPYHVAKAVMRDANTIQRRAAEDCSDEWAYKRNQEQTRPTAPTAKKIDHNTGKPYVEGKPHRMRPCPDCHAERRITERVEPFGITVPVRRRPARRLRQAQDERAQRRRL